MGELCDTALSACCAPGCLTILPGGTLCRAAMGGCDVAEYCTGVSAECPPDAYHMLGHECRPIAPGSLCDVPEFCSGASVACPTDLAAPSTKVCRSAGPGLECVETKYCPGTLPSMDVNAKACPTDTYANTTVICREPLGQCDIMERCSGGSFQCPLDYHRGNPPPGLMITAQCEEDGRDCSIDTCSALTKVCEPQAFPCSDTDCDPYLTAVSNCDIGNGPYPGHAFQPVFQDALMINVSYNWAIDPYLASTAYEGVAFKTSGSSAGASGGFSTPFIGGFYGYRTPSSSAICDSINMSGFGECADPELVPNPLDDDAWDAIDALSPIAASCKIDDQLWFDWRAAEILVYYDQLHFRDADFFYTDASAQVHPISMISTYSDNGIIEHARQVSSNPNNTCLVCQGGSSVSSWTIAPNGTACVLSEPHYLNAPCATADSDQVIGECRSGQCLPVPEPMLVDSTCRASAGPCDLPEVCPALGTPNAGVCPPDLYRNQEEPWIYYTVDLETPEGFVRIGEQNALASILNRPAMAYLARTNTSSPDVLFYAINDLSDGSGGWNVVIVDTIANETVEAVDLTLINGYPAIVYYQQTPANDSLIHYARANTTNGLGMWTLTTFNVTTFGFSSTLQPIHLLEVTGLPAIVALDASDELRWWLNTQSDGMGVWQPNVILNISTVGCTGANNCGYWSKALIVDGRPAIAYSNERMAGRSVEMAISNTSTGLDGWTRYEIEASASVAHDYVSFAVVDERPAVLYRSDTDAFALRYASNNATDGSGAWSVYSITFPGAPYATTCPSLEEVRLDGNRLMEWRERPLFAATLNSRIVYGTNSHADGSGTWSFTFEDDRLIYGIAELRKVGTSPSLTYHFSDFWTAGVVLEDAGSCDSLTSANATGTVSRFRYATIASAECRAADGACDVPEFCSGYSVECPPDDMVVGSVPNVVIRGPCEMAAPCGGNSTVNGTIAKGPMYLCRPSVGLCDAPEFCPDPELVEEWWLCPDDALYNATQECRASAGLCDPPEFCTGMSTTCPPNVLSPNGTVCRSPAGACDVAEQCDGMSAACPADVVEPMGTECRAIMGPCDLAEQCDGVSALCPTDQFIAADTVCLSARGPCEDDHVCDGATAPCNEPAPYNSTVECRMSAGACDLADFCPGNSYNCTADVKLPFGTSCRAPADLCDAEEYCDGVSNACPTDVVRPMGAVCHSARGPCEIAQVCDGLSIFCPAFQFYDDSVTCRTAIGSCDVAEQCDPFAFEPWLCPEDAYAPMGTLCALSVGDCSDSGFCTGNSSTCPGISIYNSSVLCRMAASQCDQAEYCDGVGGACPTDTFLPATTPCVANPLNCTVDECDGAGLCEVVVDNCDCMVDIDCPLNMTAPCVTATCVDGFCVEELAPGFCFIDGTCTINGLVNPANPCEECNSASMDVFSWSPRAMGTSCDTGSPTSLCSAPDTCDGMGTCVDNYLSMGTECRAAASICDAPEECDGSSDYCPMDMFAPGGTLCRNATGVCDLPEYCDNFGACPSDSVEYPGFVCDAALGDCASDGVCDGVTKDCNAGFVFPMGTPCRNATLPCDVTEVCDGVSYDCPVDAVQPDSHVCRMATGPCDIEETCDGLSKLCPTDDLYGPGQLCRMASGSCEEDGYCTLGTDQCEPVEYKPMGTVCQPSGSLCAVDAVCTGSNSTCPALAPLPNNTQCFVPRGPCEGPGFCNGVSLECQLEGLKPPGFVCRASTDAVCDPQETCNPALPSPWLCPADYKQPNGFPCPDSFYCNGDETCQAGVCTMSVSPRNCADGSPCTVDSCSEMTASCLHAPDPQIGMVCYDGPMGTADVGVCRSGTIQCLGNGTFYCANQVLPGAMEICADMLDNDCNGVPDEGCEGVTCVDDGDCIPFAPTPCQVGVCNIGTNLCEYPVIPLMCLIDGTTCVSEGEPNPSNPCQTCQSNITNTGYTPDNAQDPSDNNVCNGVEACVAGQVTLISAPLVCPVANDSCRPYSCHPTLGCIQTVLPVNTSCTLGFPLACEMGQTLCNNLGQCDCIGGILVDVRDRPFNPPTNDGDFPTWAIVLISVVAGLFILLAIGLCIIQYFTRSRRRRKRRRKEQ